LAVAREQPDAVTVTLHDQPIAVMLDFVDPVGAVADGFGAARDARFKEGFQHGWLDNSAPSEMPIQNIATRPD